MCMYTQSYMIETGSIFMFAQKSKGLIITHLNPLTMNTLELTDGIN